MHKPSFTTVTRMLINTMPIWENTDVLGQNGGGKVNRTGPTHYDIGMSLHYMPRDYIDLTYITQFST